jgi:hypothetical protein
MASPATGGVSAIQSEEWDLRRLVRAPCFQDKHGMFAFGRLKLVPMIQGFRDRLKFGCEGRETKRSLLLGSHINGIGHAPSIFQKPRCGG